MNNHSIRTRSVVTSAAFGEKIWENLVAIWVGSPENQVYGNTKILNHFANVPNNPIRGRLQHGWPAHSPNDLYYKNDFLPTLVWTSEAKEAAVRKGWSNYQAIGAPWLYLLQILEGDGWDVSPSSELVSKTESLWVYGRHALETSASNKERLLEFLSNANQNANPGDYCLLYFEDFDILSQIERSEFARLRIVTLGQRSSSFISDSHLVRIFHLLKSVGRIRIDHPSTIVLYALTLGVEVDWVKNSFWQDAVFKAQELGFHDLVKLMNSTSSDSLSHTALAFSKLGVESMKTREDLRTTLFGKTRWSRFLRTTFIPVGNVLMFPLKLLRMNLTSKHF